MRNKYIFTLLFFSLFIFIQDVQSQSGKEDYEKLVGKWVRPDGGYILVIKNVRFDGSIEVAYLNPNPINVYKARAGIKSDKINIYVELRDKGYPGSYYTLTYDKDTDLLVGVYHHAVLKQDFDIYFVRKKTTKEEKK